MEFDEDVVESSWVYLEVDISFCARSAELHAHQNVPHGCFDQRGYFNLTQGSRYCSNLILILHIYGSATENTEDGILRSVESTWR